ncbi:type I phosphomannose isomerase catalytic subunit [Malacoplasma iowae]|uniref:type I phosphomannose isomerase catalytic subunit n=1 Tax=Malacoplasma iowae TaxID=2116 RepID=UPI002A18821C|nr:type I phosphomannose isomerase catalytic subunit [Malacoplasma iowae]WPL40139.1 class I mannose-6-phosphate isomerase [Malacoplasma iowae]
MEKIIFLEPFIQETIWGGKRLKEYGYNLPYEKNGEAWIISAIKDKESKIKGINKSLREFYIEKKSFFNNYNGEYPLLVKIIDANDDLSIQVHPDNEYAKNKHGKYGKSECWYILDCKNNSDIVYGHNAKNKTELIDYIKNNKWDNLLKVIKIDKNDFIDVPPGTIHAIKNNTLIYEVQQSSDITYRLYDYDRLSNGKHRELHINDSLNVIYYPQNNLTISKTNTNYDNKIQLLLENQYFKIIKINVNSNLELLFDDAHWVQATVIDGNGFVDNIKIRKGDNFLVAHNSKFKISSQKMTIIISYVPIKK